MAEGGHMVIARSLTQALREAGHDADIIVTPQNRFGRQASAYIATWFTDVGVTDGRKIDRVISLRYPSYAVRHDQHVCWLNHTMREYYDLWDQFSPTLSAMGLMKERLRRAAIRASDRYLLGRNVRKLFVQSRTIQQRLAMWPEIRSTVLYPPAPQRPYRCDGYGDYIFMVSRLTALKRAHLLIEAMTTAEGRGIRTMIAGEGEAVEKLRALIVVHNLQDRVRLLGRLDESALIEHLAKCRAVCFPPLQEDYGFVTVEAFASGKAVITCKDSGGPAELVTDGVTGFVCDPTPEALAAALRRLTDDQPLAERLGGAALARGAELNWPDAVRQLTA
jgi:glycosyltransferase involved in cell wall biosynthesis